MDTTNPTVFVNAERYVGRKVQAVIEVVSKEGAVVVGKSTDEKQIVVKGLPPSQLATFTEVIGIADSQNSITADIWTHFDICKQAKFPSNSMISFMHSMRTLQKDKSLISNQVNEIGYVGGRWIRHGSMHNTVSSMTLAFGLSQLPCQVRFQ